MEGILAYVGIGSNMGDCLRQCKQAVQKLSCAGGVALEKTSSFYKTEPVIDGQEARQNLEHQNWYVNAVAEIRTTLSPRELLDELQKIEKNMGRTRQYKGAPRTMDLDLLLYGQEIIRDRDLMVPHPEMHKRLFVLEPLCEIASYLIHPVFGVSMRGLKDRLNDHKSVEIYKN